MSNFCFLLLPTLNSGRKYYSCCGKRICSGCSYAVEKTKERAISLCPFCRVPTHTSDEEANERDKKLADAGNASATYNLGVYYRDGKYGFRQDHDKALKLWHRAGDLGCSEAYTNIGYAYDTGSGVEVDKKKAKHCYKLSAMGGNATARYNLGRDELQRGNLDRAVRHHMIAIRGGYHNSLNMIKQLYSNGHATKEDYTKALQAYRV